MARKSSSPRVATNQQNETNNNPAAPAVATAGQSPSQADRLRGLFATLLRSRRVHERAPRTTASGVAHHEPRPGHEAVIVGVSAELTPADAMTAPSPDLAVLLARGAPVRALLTGDAADAGSACWRAPALPEDPVHAGVGIAVAHKLEGKRRVVVALCGPPPAAPRSWHDAFKAATRQKLPILFVVENSDATTRNGGSHLLPVSFMVRGHGLPGMVVDGSDVVAIWRVAQEAVHRARNGMGPTLVDCRMDPARDPLAQLEHYLRKRGAWDDAWRHKLESEIAEAMAR